MWEPISRGCQQMDQLDRARATLWIVDGPEGSLGGDVMLDMRRVVLSIATRCWRRTYRVRREDVGW